MGHRTASGTITTNSLTNQLMDASTENYIAAQISTEAKPHSVIALGIVPGQLGYTPCCTGNMLCTLSGHQLLQHNLTRIL